MLKQITLFLGIIGSIILFVFLYVKNKIYKEFSRGGENKKPTTATELANGVSLSGKNTFTINLEKNVSFTNIKPTFYIFFTTEDGKKNFNGGFFVRDNFVFDITNLQAQPFTNDGFTLLKTSDTKAASGVNITPPKNSGKIVYIVGVDENAKATIKT